MIHGIKGISSYFQGGFATYGKHQWNVKLINHTEFACEQFAIYFLDDRDFINSELGMDVDGKPIEFHLDGRSGGWLVSNNNLSVAQIEYITGQITQLKAGEFNHLLCEQD